MKTYNIVELALDALQKRVDAKSQLWIQAEQGYCEPAGFHFNDPASEDEVDYFFQELKVAIPLDFKQFLIRHNGARLFVHPVYGGGIEIFGLDEIYTHHIEYDYIHIVPQGWYAIGSDNGDMLFIDSTKCSANNREADYLYWTEMLFTDSAIDLEMNFERWLERLMICNGAHFWNWKNETGTSYYRHLDSSAY